MHNVFADLAKGKGLKKSTRKPSLAGPEASATAEISAANTSVEISTSKEGAVVNATTSARSEPKSGQTSWNDQVAYMMDRGSIENLLVISSEDGAMWASSAPFDESKPDQGFYLREYKAMITKEDGSETEETVNEAKNILTYMKGQTCGQGLRINGTKKQQITRTSKGDETDLPVVLTKVPMGGSIVASAGKCILIATFDENKGHQAAACNDTMNIMANYILKSTWGAESNDSVGSAHNNADPATWQSYVDLMLVGKGNIADAMICNADTVNPQVLASTLNFEFKTYEADIMQEDGTEKKEKVEEMKNLQDFAKTGVKPSQGLRINQVKYQVIRANVDDENSKCKVSTAKKPMGGVTVFVVPNKYILVGSYDEKKGHIASESYNTISDLAKHLHG